MKNRKTFLWFGGAGLLFVLLALHRSAKPTWLSRYSAGYLAFLVVYIAAVACVTALYRSRYRESLEPRALVAAARAALLPELSPRHFLALVIAALLMHTALVFVFLPPSVALSSEPILETDYAHHYDSVATAVSALTRYHRSWAYDPGFCAGYPAGTLFDVDVKLIEVAAFALSRFGVSVGRAFNMVILAYFLTAPLLLLLACKNFGWPRTTTLFIVASGILLWHANPMIIDYNWQGMCSFVFAAYAALYAVSLVDRYLREARITTLLVLAVTVAVTLHVHILAPFLLAGPTLALYASSFRRLSVRQHVLLAIAALVAAAANVWWIATVIHFYRFRTLTKFGAPHSWSGVADFFQQLTSPPIVLALLGAWGFYLVRDRRRDIAVMGLVALAWFFLLSDLSGHIPVIKTLEPERFRIPLAIFGAMGFAIGVAEVLADGELPRVPRRAALPVAVAAVLLFSRTLSPISSLLYRFRSTPADYAPLVGWIRGNTTSEARIAVMDLTPGFFAPSRLRYYVDRPFIGGPFSELDMKHNYASFTKSRFFTKKLTEVTKDDVARYADLYNIKWIVTSTADGCAHFGEMSPVVERVARFPMQETADAVSPLFKRDTKFPICAFEVKRTASYFLKGSGEVKAGLNRIAVHGASSGGVVLAFHWLDTLAVDPPLPIRRHDVEGSPIGFIEVDNGPTTEFLIYNAYNH